VIRLWFAILRGKGIAVPSWHFLWLNSVMGQALVTYED
jgi:hypothetical protein